MDIHTRLIRIQEARRKLDGADVQLNHRLERENSLLDSMKRQNRKAKQEMMKKYGMPFKPADPNTIPKPINFREFVEVDEIARNPDYTPPQKPGQDMANMKALAKALMKKKGIQVKKKPPPANEGVDIKGLLAKHKAGKKIGSTNLARLKARGLVKRADGTKVDKGNRWKS